MNIYLIENSSGFAEGIKEAYIKKNVANKRLTYIKNIYKSKGWDILEKVKNMKN